MTKRNNLIVALMLLALLVLTAAPAAAKGKPPKPDPLPDGMCTFADAIDIATAPTLTGPEECIDVSSLEATAWEFSVEITGKRPEGIKQVYLSVREEHPGDFCWVFWSENPQLLDNNPTDQAITFVVTTDVIPASAPNACSGDPNGDDPTDSMVVTLVTRGSKKDATTEVTIRPAP